MKATEDSDKAARKSAFGESGFTSEDGKWDVNKNVSISYTEVKDAITHVLVVNAKGLKQEYFVRGGTDKHEVTTVKFSNGSELVADLDWVEDKITIAGGRYDAKKGRVFLCTRTQSGVSVKQVEVRFPEPLSKAQKASMLRTLRPILKENSQINKFVGKWPKEKAKANLTVGAGASQPTPPGELSEKDAAVVVGLIAPVSVKKISYYKDGGTTGIMLFDSIGREYPFCLDHRLDGSHSRHIFIGATHPTKSGAQELPLNCFKFLTVYSVRILNSFCFRAI